MYRRVPALSCLMSTFPAVSLGGTVRRASRAMAPAGTASVGSGGSTKPPRSSAACSRAVVTSSRRRSGASPMVPHERRAGDAHARQVVGGGPAVGDRPAHHERLGELVAQEAEAGHLHGVAVAVRLDVEDLDLEDVTVLGPVDVDGPGARV